MAYLCFTHTITRTSFKWWQRRNSIIIQHMRQVFNILWNNCIVVLRMASDFPANVYRFLKFSPRFTKKHHAQQSGTIWCHRSELKTLATLIFYNNRINCMQTYPYYLWYLSLSQVLITTIIVMRLETTTYI